jgi:hypothetical protein
MRVVEFVTCHLPEDPASPMPAGGYMVACMTFYKRGFSVPSHRFLFSLLLYYEL